jgi:deoxyribose-phosphate aldolase
MYSDFAINIDLTALEQTVTLSDVERLCQEGIENKVMAICVPPLFVKKANSLTAGSEVKVATVIGFPYGYSAIEAKLAEIVLAIIDGADELDMVVNITALKNNDWQYLAKEINTILPIIQNKEKLLKVIVECSLLSPEEIVTCCDIYGAVGVDFFSISTGIDLNPPKIETIQLIRKHLSDATKIKASGKNITDELIKEYLKAGANRIGIGFSAK